MKKNSGRKYGKIQRTELESLHKMKNEIKERRGNDKSWHVYPVNDTKPHDTNHGALCKCQPVTEIYENGVTVIHNSFDGREFFEGTEH